MLSSENSQRKYLACVGHTACKSTLSEMLSVTAGPSATAMEYFPVLNTALWMNLLNTALAATTSDCDCHIIASWHCCIGLLLGGHSAVLINGNLREKNQKAKTQDGNHSTVQWRFGDQLSVGNKAFHILEKKDFRLEYHFLLGYHNSELRFKPNNRV